MGTPRKGKPHPRTHGHTVAGKASPTYQSWATMHVRCSNTKSKHYARYGGRGISVCDRWSSFRLFLEDMGERPAGTTLDREDNDGNYTKENCRWVDRSTQANNTSITVRVTIRGETMSLTNWCKRIGISINTVRSRVRNQGMSYEEALEKPTRRPNGKLASGFYPGDPNNPRRRRDGRQDHPAV